MNLLRVLELNMETIETKESWIKELMYFVWKNCANYKDTNWMTFVSFNEFLVPEISSHNHDEE